MVTISNQEDLSAFKFDGEGDSGRNSLREGANQHLSTADTAILYRTGSPIIGLKNSGKRLVRPKSVPSSLYHPTHRADSAKQRPKTASVYSYKECDRLSQVEREATRKHNFKSQFPAHKTPAPPWQKNFDSQGGPPAQVMLHPGYKLSKNKSKIEVHINTKEFFEPPPDKHAKLRNSDPERDSLISQLQQQIDDLTVFLEEERLNHRETKRNAAEHLRDRVEELTRHHDNYVKELNEKYTEEIDRMKIEFEEVLTKEQETSGNKIRKLNKDIEFLQAAFESYKSGIHFETDERWKAREGELRSECEEKYHEKLAAFKKQWTSEWTSEKSQLEKHYRGDLANARKDHKKEMDGLMRRYSNQQVTIDRLDKAEKELSTSQQELSSVRQDYEDVCRRLTDVSQELADTKMQLADFRVNFQGKVQEVDEKYQSQMEQQKQSNIELRRLYVKKCSELFDEKAVSDTSIRTQMESAKETMREIIETRNRSQVSVAAHDPRLEKTVGLREKSRRVSDPVTVEEHTAARLSAGQTYQYEQAALSRRPQTCKPRIFYQIQDEIEAGTLVIEEPSLPENPEDLLLTGLN